MHLPVRPFPFLSHLFSVHSWCWPCLSAARSLLPAVSVCSLSVGPHARCAIHPLGTSHLGPAQPSRLHVPESLWRSFPAVYPGSCCACELCASGPNSSALQISCLLPICPSLLSLIALSLTSFFSLSIFPWHLYIICPQNKSLSSLYAAYSSSLSTLPLTKGIYIYSIYGICCIIHLLVIFTYKIYGHTQFRTTQVMWIGAATPYCSFSVTVTTVYEEVVYLLVYGRFSQRTFAVLLFSVRLLMGDLGWACASIWFSINHWLL